MSQAEKLMHELTQNCGIDFNNTRRKLAVEIIERYFVVIAEANSNGFLVTVDPSRVDVSDPSITLAGVPSVADAIAAPKKSKKKAKESSDASGQ